MKMGRWPVREFFPYLLNNGPYAKAKVSFHSIDSRLPMFRSWPWS